MPETSPHALSSGQDISELLQSAPRPFGTMPLSQTGNPTRLGRRSTLGQQSIRSPSHPPTVRCATAHCEAGLCRSTMLCAHPLQKAQQRTTSVLVVTSAHRNTTKQVKGHVAAHSTIDSIADMCMATANRNIRQKRQKSTARTCTPCSGSAAHVLRRNGS